MKRTRRIIAACVAVCVLLALMPAVAADVPAEPITLTLTVPLRLTTPSVCTTDGGSTVRLPPVYVLSWEQWDKLDAETRRLQSHATRTDAQIKILEPAASSRSSLGTWLTVIGLAVAGGMAFGAWRF